MGGGLFSLRSLVALLWLSRVRDSKIYFFGAHERQFVITLTSSCDNQWLKMLFIMGQRLGSTVTAVREGEPFGTP
jgi:hypothetical protein